METSRDIPLMPYRSRPSRRRARDKTVSTQDRGLPGFPSGMYEKRMMVISITNHVNFISINSLICTHEWDHILT